MQLSQEFIPPSHGKYLSLSPFSLFKPMQSLWGKMNSRQGFLDMFFQSNDNDKHGLGEEWVHHNMSIYIRITIFFLKLCFPTVMNRLPLVFKSYLGSHVLSYFISEN